MLDESLQVLEHNQLWEIEKTMRVRSAKLTPLELEMLEVKAGDDWGKWDLICKYGEGNPGTVTLYKEWVQSIEADYSAEGCPLEKGQPVPIEGVTFTLLKGILVAERRLQDDRPMDTIDQCVCLPAGHFMPGGCGHEHHDGPCEECNKCLRCQGCVGGKVER